MTIHLNNKSAELLMLSRWLTNGNQKKKKLSPAQQSHCYEEAEAG